VGLSGGGEYNICCLASRRHSPDYLGLRIIVLTAEWRYLEHLSASERLSDELSSLSATLADKRGAADRLIADKDMLEGQSAVSYRCNRCKKSIQGCRGIGYPSRFYSIACRNSHRIPIPTKPATQPFVPSKSVNEGQLRL